MVTSNPPSILIRDGLENDISTCLALDHDYETDMVWQMQIYHEDHRDEYQINLKMERLPRTIAVTIPPDEASLKLALPSDQCFLVAVNREQGQVFGYLTMYHDTVRQIGHVQSLVVHRPQRRREIGTRLINVARRWAKEHGIMRMTLHTQTKNYPAIAFCQQMGFAFCGFNDRYFVNQDIAVFFSQSLR